MTRDTQRQKVYDAENVLSPGGMVYDFSWRNRDGVKLDRKDAMTLDECQAFVDAMIRTRWWRNRFRDIRAIWVRDGRGRRRAAGFRGIGRGHIKLPRWSRTPHIILHEVAHVVTPERPAHGREYARNLLDLVVRFLGPDAGRKLRAAYKVHGVRYRPPGKSWDTMTQAQKDRALANLAKGRAAKQARKEGGG